ncbi:MAG: hypothetical protein U9O96_08415 [Candidatus Thermoplasmatota archaeon]|nr:hypothetical protein [Candidatus Thermoplasmatota archaeon]
MEIGKEIISELYRHGLIKTWFRDHREGWRLVSGIWSPFYIQIRSLPSYPILLKKVGRYMGEMIKKECDANKILGIAMAGIPIATAISTEYAIPLCYTRKLKGVKSLNELEEAASRYGEHSLVEGEINEGDRFVAVDDLVTKFDSKLVAIEQLKMEGNRRGMQIKCVDVAVIIDREQGAGEIAKKYGIGLHALIPFKSKGIEWLKDFISTKEYEVIKDYLNNSEKYQDEKYRKELL